MGQGGEAARGCKAPALTSVFCQPPGCANPRLLGRWCRWVSCARRRPLGSYAYDGFLALWLLLSDQHPAGVAGVTLRLWPPSACSVSFSLFQDTQVGG